MFWYILSAFLVIALVKVDIWFDKWSHKKRMNRALKNVHPPRSIKADMWNINE